MGRLTTRVLDLAEGRPVRDLRINLWRLGPADARHLVRTAVTNSDGRVEPPLLAGDEMEPGTYELIFDAAAYWEGQGRALTNPPFLGEIPIRFGISDPRSHYHVPLLLAPWGYSTYGGG